MPESFNVLVTELKSLGLNIEALTDEGKHIGLADIEVDAPDATSFMNMENLDELDSELANAFIEDAAAASENSLVDGLADVDWNLDELEDEEPAASAASKRPPAAAAAPVAPDTPAPTPDPSGGGLDLDMNLSDLTDLSDVDALIAASDGATPTTPVGQGDGDADSKEE
jgi:hypothetical protein